LKADCGAVPAQWSQMCRKQTWEDISKCGT